MGAAGRQQLNPWGCMKIKERMRHVKHKQRDTISMTQTARSPRAANYSLFHIDVCRCYSQKQSLQINSATSLEISRSQQNSHEARSLNEICREAQRCLPLAALTERAPGDGGKPCTQHLLRRKVQLLAFGRSEWLHYCADNKLKCLDLTMCM